MREGGKGVVQVIGWGEGGGEEGLKDRIADVRRLRFGFRARDRGDSCRGHLVDNI